MEFETDTPQDMEMPTPCPCGRWVELNDMNSCGTCDQLFCHQCVPRNGDNCPDHWSHKEQADGK